MYVERKKKNDEDASSGTRITRRHCSNRETDMKYLCSAWYKSSRMLDLPWNAWVNRQEIKGTRAALLCGVLHGGGRKGTNTRQNRNRFELYISAISDKLKEGFIINHKNAALPTRRIAWWAAARDLRVLLPRLVWSSGLQVTLLSTTPVKYVLFNKHAHTGRIKIKVLISAYSSYGSALLPQKFYFYSWLHSFLFSL